MFVINTFQTNAKSVRCTEKWSFSLRIIQVMWQNSQFLPDLVTFAEETVMEYFIFCTVG